MRSRKEPVHGGHWLRRHLVGLLLAAIAVTPTLGSVMQAAAGSNHERNPRERILKRLPSDPTVLINVTRGDMPSSSDVLNLGKRSTRALERCLADNVDEAMRWTCAELLGYLGDRRALPSLQTALEDWDQSVRLMVIDVLARMPDESSFGPLMRLYRRRDESRTTRAAILNALGKLSTQQGVQVLRQVLHHDPSKEERARREDLRRDAFQGLWASRHLVARATLAQDVAYALRSDDDQLVYSATEAAAELRDASLVEPLTKLVGHTDAEIRNRSVYALGVIGNRAATQVLTREMPRVREARMLNNIAFALDRLDRREYNKTIQALAQHKQAIIRLNAAFVVGDVKQPDGLPLLSQSLEDPSDLVKASAIVAIGKLGAEGGIRSLTKYTNHPNPSLKEEAIYAINRLSGGKHLDLIYAELYDSAFARGEGREAIRRRAAVELGKAGDRRVRDYLLLCYETHECELSSVRGYLTQDNSAEVTRRLFLGWAQGRVELTTELARRRPAGLVELALGRRDSAEGMGHLEQMADSIDLVGQLGKRQDREEISRHLQHEDLRLRLHAAVALIRLGDTSASKRLLSDLDNLPVEWLSTFVGIASRIEEASARQLLGPELERRTRGDDLELALACAAVLLNWDPERGFFRFLDALAAQRVQERELALRYLQRNRSPTLTWVLRRALARETRPYTRDRLRQLLDKRGAA